MSEVEQDVFERTFSEEMAAVADTLMGAEAETEAVETAAEEAPEVVAEPAAEHVAEVAPEPKAERRDWKAEAIAETERLKALEAAKPNVEQPKAAEPAGIPPAPDPIVDPEGFIKHQQFVAFNERLNVSEMLVREKFEDVDEKIAAFKEEAAQNPALMQRLQTERHPWKWAYEHGAKALARREIGDDPAAFRAKIEAELREKLLAEIGAQAAPAAAPAAARPVLPPDLSGARSVSGRTSTPAPKVSGFDALFPDTRH